MFLVLLFGHVITKKSICSLLFPCLRCFISWVAWNPASHSTIWSLFSASWSSLFPGSAKILYLCINRYLLGAGRGKWLHIARADWKPTDYSGTISWVTVHFWMTQVLDRDESFEMCRLQGNFQESIFNLMATVLKRKPTDPPSPSSYQLPSAPKQEVRLHHHLRAPCWDFVWLHGSEDLCLLSQSLRVHMCICSDVSRKCRFLTVIFLLWLWQSSHPFFCNNPKVFGGGNIVYACMCLCVPFRAKYASFFCTLTNCGSLL